MAVGKMKLNIRLSLGVITANEAANLKVIRRPSPDWESSHCTPIFPRPSKPNVVQGDRRTQAAARKLRDDPSGSDQHPASHRLGRCPPSANVFGPDPDSISS